MGRLIAATVARPALVNGMLKVSSQN